MSISIAICDDEIIHLNILKNYIKDILDARRIDYTLVEFTSGEKLLEEYPKNIDIIFLDIQMEELSGMDTAIKIREFDSRVDVIFTTSFTDYVYQGYEVNAYRYILKPLEYVKIEECIIKLNKKRSDYISIKQTDYNGDIKIKISSILYLETINRCVEIYTDTKKYTTRIKLSDIEKDLANHNFYRCHRCYLINLEKSRITKQNTVKINNTDIPISRLKLKEFKVKLANILGDKL